MSEFNEKVKNEPRPTLLTETGRIKTVEPMAEPITDIGMEEQIPTVLGAEINDKDLPTVIGREA